MRLAHHCYHGDTRCCTDGFGLEFGEESLLVRWRDSGNDVHQSGLRGEPILAGNLTF